MTVHVADIFSSLAKDFREAEYRGIVDLHKMIIANAVAVVDGDVWDWRKTDSLIMIQGEYTTGTVTVSKHSTAVVGDSTEWTTQFEELTHVEDEIFTGSGEDDLESGGTYTHTSGNSSFTISIASTPGGGLADTFDWTQTGGSGGSGAGVNCATTATTLSDGVTVTFGAIDGHTIGDQWDFKATVATNDKYGSKMLLGDSAYQWYRVSSFGSDTSITLAENYVGDDIQAGTYTLYCDEYKLPSDCMYNGVVSVIEPSNAIRLERVGQPTTEDAASLMQVTFSYPQYYDIFRDATNDVQYIRLFPAPGDDQWLRIHYLKSGTSFLGGTPVTTADIPIEYRDAIYLRTKRDVYERLGDARFQVADNEYKFIMKKLRGMYAHPPGKQSRTRTYPGKRRGFGVTINTSGTT